MKKLFVIGIGSGNPEHVTLQAVTALNRVDVVFALDKGPRKSDLTDLRKQICARLIEGRQPRWVEADSPSRESAGPYRNAVADWHEEKSVIFARMIREEMRDGETGAFLVWGDPSLYDSTIRILELMASHADLDFDFEVIPGVSSLHALTAAHKIPLNTIAEPVLITTGRKLAEAYPAGIDTVVVMLDGGPGLEAIAGRELQIWWGAYLGTEDEVLISGRVPDVLDEILKIRKALRAEKGWIMDIYLLRPSREG